MLIAYCETCGFRIPESDLTSGSAVKLDENRYACAKCTAASTAKKPPTKMLTRQAVESARATLQSAGTPPTTPPQGRATLGAGRAAPSAGHSTHSAASATASRTAAPAKAAKNANATLILVGGGAGALGLLLIVLFAGGKKPVETNPTTDKPDVVAQNETKTGASSAITPGATSVTNSPVTPAVKLGGTTTAETPAAVTLSPANAQERIRNADKELENMRDERAARLLEEAKAWYAAHSEDPWTYKEKLGTLVSSYRSAPAAVEAGKLLAEVKLPEGERGPDSMMWYRDWNFTPGVSVISDFDGRKYVLPTHPAAPGKPFLMSRKMKVPTDKPVLEFSIRAHEAGDFRLIVEISGKSVFNDIIGGRTWRTFSVDLSSLKGQDVDVSLQHHNTDWNFEHAWWTAPRFVEKPASGAKVAVFDPNAPNAVAAAPAAFVSTQGKGWKTVFDGKSLDAFSPNVLDGWKLDDGAMVNLPGTKNATKPRMQFEDGEVRVRFETTGGTFMHFTIRQSDGGGYGVNFDRTNLPQMSGKKHELIFTLRGDEVSAVVDGAPVPVQVNGKPARGQLQYSITDGTLRVNSIEYREPGAWRPLFDTGSLDGLLGRGNNNWKTENGVLVNTAGASLQSNTEVEEGDLRIRFEVKGAQYIQFATRHSETPGYMAVFDKGNIALIDGKPSEIIFSMRGESVTATVNGQPIDLKMESNVRPRKGRMQIYLNAGTIRIFGVELADAAANAVVAVQPAAVAAGAEKNFVLDPGFESGAWGIWSTWGTSSIYKGAEHVHGGNCSAMINTEKNGMGQTVKGLTPGVTYELSGWGKLAVSGEFFQIGIKDYGGTEKFEAFTSNEFKRISLKFTLGPTNTTAVVYSYKPHGPGAAYLDDVVLVPEGSLSSPVAAVNDTATKTVPGTSTTAAAASGDLKMQYEQLLADVSAMQFKNGIAQAVTKLESARSDPKLAALSGMLENDVKLARFLEEINKGASKGAAALVDKRAFTLHKTDGKDLNVGKGSNNAVTDVKDDTIFVEQDLGGGKALSKWALDQLTAQSRYDLAKIGMAPGPESELKLAAAAVNLLQNGGDISQRLIRMHLDAAKKGATNADLVAHLNGRLEARELEANAEAAFKKLDGLIKDKKWADAKAFIAAYKKDYSGTLALAKVSAALEQKSVDVEYALNPLKPMLWESFWSGEEANKFKTMHFARADSKTNWDFGPNSPDPRVPADNFGIKFGGKLRIDKPGVYRFRGDADDHMELHIDGQLVLESNNNNVEKDVTLTKGDHDIKMLYFESSGPAHLFFHWKMEGSFDWQELPVDRLWHDPHAAEKYQNQ